MSEIMIQITKDPNNVVYFIEMRENVIMHLLHIIVSHLEVGMELKLR